MRKQDNQSEHDAKTCRGSTWPEHMRARETHDRKQMTGNRKQEPNYRIKDMKA